MLSEELIKAIESLERLQDHYQDEYEYYLAKAMEVKEHQEKIEVLLKDLVRRDSEVSSELGDAVISHDRENYRELGSGIQKNEASLLDNHAEDESTFLRRRRKRKGLNLLEGQPETANGTNGVKSEEDFLDDEPEMTKFDFGSSIDSTESQSETDNSERELDSVARFLELSKIVMPAIEEIFKSEANKTLHLSYIQKTLNSKLNLQLSVEAVKLYLDQAIEQGYCRLDSYDRSCYVSNENKSKSPINESEVTNSTSPNDDVDSNGKVISEINQVEPNRDKTSSTKSKAVKSTQRKKLYNLPPSSKLKVTLLKTVKGFLAEHKLDVFTSQDIIDYLYTKKQQSSWSKNQVTKIRQAIGNVLGRDSYLGTEWERVKLGKYRALN
ncbi:hypothetical protein [Myxosarcina sp. GI1]|uniref:hypothetical protein n=1 Tax=Myxosarcina sp. GI1 TaxID=1541065 RepID=UPI00056C6DF7|nr:hypothetical protein [Myxosarcina sp. GI1]